MAVYISEDLLINSKTKMGSVRDPGSAEPATVSKFVPEAGNKKATEELQNTLLFSILPNM